MRAISRVLVGLTAACVAAALVKVLHVITPADLAGLSGDALTKRLLRLGDLILVTATQEALFVVPLALMAVTVCEFNRWRALSTYILIAVFVATAGFYVQVASENDLRTIVNAYAIRAYYLEGLAAALVYWFVAGRYAGWRRGGGLIRATPYPVGAPRLRVSDAIEAGPTDGRKI